MRKGTLQGLAAAVGLLLLAAGLAVLKIFDDPRGIWAVLPYVCVGVGCGALGHGVGGLVSNHRVKNNPALQKQLEIEACDERNIAIANQAKAKAYDGMLYVFGALMVAVALMDVGMAAILLLVGAYLLVVGCFIYYLYKFQSEM